MCKLLTLCGVGFISMSSRGAHLSLWCPAGSYWIVGLCPLWFGCGWLHGGVLSAFGARGSSLILVGLLLSRCEGLYSAYFISICGRRVFFLSPAGLHSSFAGEIHFSFGWGAPQWKTGWTVKVNTSVLSYNQRLKSKFNYCQHTKSFSPAPVSSLSLSWLFARIIEIIQHLFFCVWLLLLNTMNRF